jgi:hypothetical protein
MPGVGLDWAEDYHDVALGLPGKGVIEQFRIDHGPLECECDWEPEHGLQIVFRDGREVTKVGPYDGHLTNSAAYANDDLDGIVYYRS